MMVSSENSPLPGFSQLESQAILKGLGRIPNPVELGVFSAMWSEHCSYKHTRGLLKELPGQADWVLQGPGENAGVISIGDEWAVVFKIESHNHPSFIAPYDGAGTGVGGLLRDVMAMGARPVGVKTLLRSGPIVGPATQEMVRQIRQGADEYARACGVASLGTELITHPSYSANPLVNVLVLGLARKSCLMRSGAGQPGNLLLYFGRPTGPDGVHGAAFASKGMDETTEAHPPAGDPQAGNELMQATLECIEEGVLEGLQDMGAAGLTCSSFEMANRSGCGFQLDLDQVPQSRPGLTPEELLLSETQERMLASVRPDRLQQALYILSRYPRLSAAVIGRITSNLTAVLAQRRQIVASLPTSLVVEGFPRLELQKGNPSPAGSQPLTIEVDSSTCITVSSSVSSGEVYPGDLQAVFTAESGGPCSRVDFPTAGKSIYLRTLSNGLEVLAGPYRAAYDLVAQARQDLLEQGAQPLGLTDGLNFGDPEDPAVAYQLAGVLRGLGDACLSLGIPVVGGNVSLYNETHHAPILGQLMIGMVGVKEI